MEIRVLEEGFVSRRPRGTGTSACGVSRCAVSANGDIISTFAAQSAKAVNDFKVMLCRSSDGGHTWTEARPLWPELHERYSIYGSISVAPTGGFLFFGTRTPIDVPGEMCWSEATLGLKQCELIWTTSVDGDVWDPFRVIPLPFPGSPEAPGAMVATRAGDLLCCYSPYNTFNPKEAVKKDWVVCLKSRDRGRTWRNSAMFQFPFPNSQGAEAWLTELTDGRILGTCWHSVPNGEQPNPYAISHDGGDAWTEMASTGILGQTTALAGIPDNRALFAYNQRNHGTTGVWLAVVKPTDRDFGIIANECVWAADRSVQSKTAKSLQTWTGFGFGSPSATLLPDGTVLVTLWALEGDEYSIRYVKVRLTGT